MSPVPPAQPNHLAGLSLALDRTSERRSDTGWIATRAHNGRTRYLLLDANGDAFLERDQAALRTLDDEERQTLLNPLVPSFLGVLGNRAWFLLVLDEANDAAALSLALNARRVSLRMAGLQLDARQAGLFAYAKGLAHWQRETRFCPFCGSPLRLVSAGHRAECTNVECGRLQFPRVDAAVIMLVEHQGACLLGRQAGWPPGRWSTLAGFVEPGEALEDAVRREVAEESGVIVDSVTYHSSQPWPMPASLMVGFMATAMSRTIAMRDLELEGARWFTPQEIATGIADGSLVPSTALSISHRLLADWLQQRAGLDLAAMMEAAPAP
ncbi:MAG: NAD(+) diphosphatase [Rhodanobacter sp.]